MSEDIMSAKQQLDSISPTFCAIKWKHTAINIKAGTMKTCCHHQFQPIENSKNINDSKNDQRIRWALLNGARPEECRYCWDMEETGHFSDRIHWSGMPWMRDFVRELPKGVGGRALPPSWLELTLSPTCNLKCSYCNPEVSSAWYKEIQEHGPYMTSVPHNDLEWFTKGKKSPYRSDAGLSPEMFWGWLSKVMPDVKHLTLTGGEPLLAKELFEILDWLNQNPQPDLELSINSNCSLPTAVWNRFLQKVQALHGGRIKSVYLHPSLDAWGAQAEYIRFGLDLSLFQENIDKYLEQTEFNAFFNCTLNALSLPSLKNYWAYIGDLASRFPRQYISSTVENLSYPGWQSTRILEPSCHDFFYEAFEYVRENSKPNGPFEPRVLESLLRAERFMKSSLPHEQITAHRKNLYVFFKEHDRRRGTSFEATFPEYRDFWHLCRELVEGSQTESNWI